jgi:hypothetical protein
VAGITGEIINAWANVEDCKLLSSNYSHAEHALILQFIRVYNNHIFVDWRDRRLGNGSFNYSASSFQAAAINGTIQSLPDFDNPCERIWHRYFSTTTSHLTWFTRRHNVSKNVMINDCERSVADWQKSLMQIR